jgi:hypothetical protein
MNVQLGNSWRQGYLGDGLGAICPETPSVAKAAPGVMGLFDRSILAFWTAEGRIFRIPLVFVQFPGGDVFLARDATPS